MGGVVGELMEISNRDQLEKWLQGQTPDVSVMMAARAALRVLPALDVLSDISTAQSADIILPVFRAMALPWAAATDFGASAAVSASAEVTGANAASAADVAYAWASVATAADAADAAAYATYTITSDATYISVYASYTAAFAAKAAVASSFFSAIEGDASLIERGVSVPHIACQSLWPEEPPDWVQQNWTSLKSRLLALDEDWQVWTDWYQDRLAGREPNELLEIARATIDQGFWDLGSAEVNAHIKELIEKFAPEEESNEDIAPPDLEQRPAIYQFDFDKGKIKAYPLEGRPDDQDITTDIHAETLAKAKELFERLKTTQAPQRVLNTIERLIDTLGDRVRDTKPGLLLARSRSLEADISAFDSEEARKELFADAISQMRDTLSNVDDLKACFPEILHIESQRLAQNLSEHDIEAVLQQRNRIRLAASESKMVSHEAIDALDDVERDLNETNEVINTSNDDQVRADALRKRAQLASLMMLDLRNFVAATLKPLKQEGRAFWREFSKNIGKKTGKAASDGVAEATKAGVKVGLALLVAQLAGPLAGIALALVSWRPLAKRAEEIKQDMDDQEMIDT